MYSGYKCQDALDEYAIRFFALLDEGYRQQNADYLMLATIGDLPHADRQHRTETYQKLQWATQHPSDILNSNDQGSSPEDIKRLLKG